MAFDEGLAQRIEDALVDQPDLVAKKMLGGLGYMVHGSMACGVHGDSLIVRVGPAAYEEALGQPYVSPFDMTGRPMKGWVYVGKQAISSEEDLKTWIERGVAFALTLPPK